MQIKPLIKLRMRATDIDKKLQRLEERLIEGEINRSMFDKYSDKYLEERNQIEKKLIECGGQLSNLDKCLDKVIAYASKLNAAWDSGDYNQKQQVQLLMFPDGMYYNRRKDECRTLRINTVFLYMSELAGILKENKNGNIGIKTYVPALVEPTGLEPVSKHIRRRASTCLFLH